MLSSGTLNPFIIETFATSLSLLHTCVLDVPGCTISLYFKCQFSHVVFRLSKFLSIAFDGWKFTNFIFFGNKWLWMKLMRKTKTKKEINTAINNLQIWLQWIWRGGQLYLWKLADHSIKQHTALVCWMNQFGNRFDVQHRMRLNAKRIHVQWLNFNQFEISLSGRCLWQIELFVNSTKANHK